MYRRSLQKKMETESHYQFLQRLGSLPVMETAVAQLAGVYTSTKSRHSLLKYTLEVTEAGVTRVACTAKPIVNRFEKPIGSLDNFACGQLTKLESSYPIISKPTDEVLEETKNLLAPTVERVNSVKNYGVDKVTAVKDYSVNTVSGVKNYTVEKLDSVKRYGTGTVNYALETPYGKAVLDCVENVLDNTEKYVDYYLPEEEMEEDDGEDKKKDLEKEEMNALRKTVNLSSKVRQRMYSKAMRDFNNFQKRSKETVDNMTFTVDLIQYAKKHVDGVTGRMTSAKDKVAHIWEEINKTEEQVATDEAEPEGTEEKNTMERRLIATARHLTLRLKRGMAAASGTISSVTGRVLPSALQTRISQALQYTDDLYQSFAKAKNLQDVPMSALDQVRHKLAFVRASISQAVEVAASMNIVDWMAPSLKNANASTNSKTETTEGQEQETAEIELEEIPAGTMTTQLKTIVEEEKPKAVENLVLEKDTKPEKPAESIEQPKAEKETKPEQPRNKGKKGRKHRENQGPFSSALNPRVTQANGSDDLDFAEEFIAKSANK